MKRYRSDDDFIAPMFPLMDESDANREGWEFHLDQCKAYNEAVIQFPNYDCICRTVAFSLAHYLHGCLINKSIGR
jgi:hypothetical protein